MAEVIDAHQCIMDEMRPHLQNSHLCFAFDKVFLLSDDLLLLANYRFFILEIPTVLVIYEKAFHKYDHPFGSHKITDHEKNPLACSQFFPSSDKYDGDNNKKYDTENQADIRKWVFNIGEIINFVIRIGYKICRNCRGFKRLKAAYRI